MALFTIKDNSILELRLEVRQVGSVQVDLGFSKIIVDNDLSEAVCTLFKGECPGYSELTKRVCILHYHSLIYKYCSIFNKNKGLQIRKSIRLSVIINEVQS
jgi:hypothetical protein